MAGAKGSSAPRIPRRLAFIGAALDLFAIFVALGDDLRYVITAPLFDF